VTYADMFQFFRNFKPQFLDQEAPGTWANKGGVGIWKDLWMTIEKRDISA